MNKNTISVGRGGWGRHIGSLLALAMFGAPRGMSGAEPPQKPSNAPHQSSNGPAYQGQREKDRRVRQRLAVEAKRAGQPQEP